MAKMSLWKVWPEADSQNSEQEREFSVFFGSAWAARTSYHLRPQQAGASPGVGDAFFLQCCLCDLGCISCSRVSEGTA